MIFIIHIILIITHTIIVYNYKRMRKIGSKIKVNTRIKKLQTDACEFVNALYKKYDSNETLSNFISRK